MIHALISRDFVRFGGVSIIGLALDLSTAWLLAVFAGSPLPSAAFLGFVVGASVNYVLHEIWTFRSGARAVSMRRVLLYAISLGLTLSARITGVALLERVWFTDSRQKFLTLLVATGLSFVVNFFLSKYLVFRSVVSGMGLALERDGR